MGGMVHYCLEWKHDAGPDMRPALHRGLGEASERGTLVDPLDGGQGKLRDGLGERRVVFLLGVLLTGGNQPLQ